MAIQKRFIHFKKFEDFNKKKLSANEANTQYTVGVSGVIQDGEPDVLYSSYCWIKDTKQQWTHGALYDCSSHEMLIVDEEISEISTNPVQNKVVKKYVDSKIFVGTQTEYDDVADDIAEGCIVIITDQSISEPEADSGATSAVLGKGVLGQLILGKV